MSKLSASLPQVPSAKAQRLLSHQPPCLTMQGDFLDGFFSSLFMIIITELGDKTFFIAAIMAMRYARLIVFCGAILALAVMTSRAGAEPPAFLNPPPPDSSAESWRNHLGNLMERIGLLLDGIHSKHQLSNCDFLLPFCLHSSKFSLSLSTAALPAVLSAAMGYMVPTLIPVKYTQLMAFGLFAYFGVRLLRDAWAMAPGEEDEEPEEMKEAAETLNKKHDVEDPEALDANGNPIRRPQPV